MKLPTLPPELTATERLPKVGGSETGVMVLVDQGWLKAVTAQDAEAIGAVKRANDRVTATKLLWRCTRAIFETGKAPADCPTDSTPAN